MKNSTPLILLLLIVFISSCTMSSDVVSDRGIQKRKYRKGFFADFGKKHKAKQLAYAEADREEIQKMTKTAKINVVENDLAYSPASPRTTHIEGKTAEKASAQVERQITETTEIEVPANRKGLKSELSAFSSIAVPAAVMARSNNSLLKQGLILILIGLILQLIGGFSGLLVWIGSVIALVGLIFVLVYLIRQL